ncbi:MAG TPA: ferric reductase-like transmembrane domain-containing protein [Acetobacteraceae bacterium]|nr:ferric reductase-like transmembrane domain-containing protein [Acetobacteraceae bacterium]HQU02069.1 ferric reductase-like transmembrane domain-containing protein [Acetobacteraceae bacterium]
MSSSTIPTRRRLRWFSPPWADPAGHFSAFKLTALVLCCLPALWIAGRWTQDSLGARPVTEAMLETGLWAVRFLLLSLAVTPARALFDWPRIVQLRRMLGLAAAAYTIAHIVLYAAQQRFALGFVLSQMLTVFYLILGTIATVGFLALAFTSTDAAIARMGRSWKSLHRAVYVIAVLSLWHSFLTQKIDVSLAVVPFGLFLFLMSWRAAPWKPRRTIGGLFVLVLLSTVITALGEAAWYGLASGIDPMRVLMANFSTARLSPAAYVGLDGVLVLALVTGRRALMAKSVRA